MLGLAGLQHSGLHLVHLLTRLLLAPACNGGGSVATYMYTRVTIPSRNWLSIIV